MNENESLRDINLKLKKDRQPLERRRNRRPEPRPKLYTDKMRPGFSPPPARATLSPRPTPPSPPTKQEVHATVLPKQEPMGSNIHAHRCNHVRFFLQTYGGAVTHFFATEWFCNPPVMGEIFCFSGQNYTVIKVLREPVKQGDWDDYVVTLMKT